MILADIAPDGCRYCGVAFREHCQRWTTAAGWHGWTAPTNAQRLARMRTRRAMRRSPGTTTLLHDLTNTAASGATETAGTATTPTPLEGNPKP